MASLKEVTDELEQKSKELHQIYAEAGEDLDLSKVSFIPGDGAQKAAEIKRRNREINELGAQKEELDHLQTMGRENVARSQALLHPQATAILNGQSGGSSNPNLDRPFNPRDLKRMLNENKDYGRFRDGTLREATLSFPGAYWNTLIQLSGVNTQATRLGTADMALEERTVADLMLQGSTDGNTVEYYEETTVTNAADTVAEGASKPESALAWTLRTESVRKIATWIPATKESLDDVSWLESQIRGRLAFMVRRKEEAQLLHGNGVAPNLLGLMARGIQTQAKGADPTPDAVYKAMQKVRGADGSGFAEPTAVVIHPNDWTAIKLLRTTDGIYIWGNPSDEGPDRIWGLPVRQTSEMTEGVALVGAFRPHAEVLRREGVTVTLSTEHSTYFIENKVAILAESRLALACYRPSAFASITGI